MRIFVFIVLVALASVSVFAEGTTNEGRLDVHVKGLRSSNGSLVVLLFNDQRGYPGDHRLAFMKKTVDIVNGSAHFRFERLPPDQYVVSIFHDENDNGKLDSHWYGPPSEGVGVSNNAPARFGPPDYDESRVPIGDGETKIEISLNYI